jgi:hypothetical protein
MCRMTVLVAAGVVAVGVGVISFTLGRALTVREPVAAAMPAKVAEPQLLTGTIAARAIPAPAQSQAPSAPPVAFPPSEPYTKRLALARIVAQQVKEQHPRTSYF